MYWNATDLAQFFPQPQLGRPLIGPTTVPVSASIFQGMIGQITGEVDSAIAAAGYAIPVPSGVAAYEYIRFVVTLGSRWRALQDMGNWDAAMHDRDAYWRELALLRDGKMPLPGAPKDTGELGRGLPRGGGIPSPIVTATWMP